LARANPAVSLEELVPPDQISRQLEAMLDLSFLREWVRELYAKRGRPTEHGTTEALTALTGDDLRDRN
jgi:hypothetical protein